MFSKNWLVAAASHSVAGISASAIGHRETSVTPYFFAKKTSEIIQ
jgi:hypothetical protein